eukprot:CAMPEP_0176494034 /NCGR_PEP_ID=MMETSP0200_2-20121128/9869_1 /TAXON_ID=947934 /ORGANISM="Chaetoceros sp., Strain GSL56" /LENGTH=259 /DNA_ID=CAMNT_0017891741 /DNA_START=1623 /DNA_END=2406 /DNA_ORIENTATION=-
MWSVRNGLLSWVCVFGVTYLQVWHIIRNASEYKTNSFLQDLLEGIIVFGKENQIFLALHDSPYPFLMPHILKLVQKHYNGSQPILLLSEREPHSYTKRRVEMHGQSHIMCKNTTTAASGIDPSTLEGGAFDIIGCIDRALDGMPEHEANQLNVGDLFESMTRAYEEKGMDYVVKEVEQYQNAMRGLADFAFDMFARKDKSKVEELAALMHSNISSLNVMRIGGGYCSFDVCTVEEDCVMEFLKNSLQEGQKEEWEEEAM